MLKRTLLLVFVSALLGLQAADRASLQLLILRVKNRAGRGDASDGGANPIAIDLSEVYLALSQKTIEAIELSYCALV